MYSAGPSIDGLADFVCFITLIYNFWGTHEIIFIYFRKWIAQYTYIILYTTKDVIVLYFDFIFWYVFLRPSDHVFYTQLNCHFHSNTEVCFTSRACHSNVPGDMPTGHVIRLYIYIYEIYHWWRQEEGALIKNPNISWQYRLCNTRVRYRFIYRWTVTYIVHTIFLNEEWNRWCKKSSWEGGPADNDPLI